MNVTETRRSDLYNMLDQLGLLCTEEYRIRIMRNRDINLYQSLDLTNDDIERVGYFYPHIELDPTLRDKAELWHGDIYLNPEMLTWINTDLVSYAVMNQPLDETVPVRCYYNENMVFRFSKLETDLEAHTYHVIINATDESYANIDRLEHAAYYVSQNQVKIPDYTWIDSTHIEFSAPYAKDIDFCICSNLVNVVSAMAGIGVLIDAPESKYSYQRMIVDNNPLFDIDCRFYPWICVGKDSTVRIYNDRYSIVERPEVCRLILYPEFLNITDPYRSTNTYLTNLQRLDVCIQSTDTDAQIIRKFGDIAGYFYRMWEDIPVDTNEQSDFLQCYNTEIKNESFTKTHMYLRDRSTEMIRSIVPAETYRDVILYDGTIFNDYIIRKIHKDSNGNYVEELNIGIPTYLIDSSYDMSKLSILKFNVGEDTTVMNIGEYIDLYNTAQLHIKLNRFYRNMLVLRRQVLDVEDPGETVRVGTTEPTVLDDHMWYELLVNTNPEDFETNAISMINLAGLSETDIPDSITKGAYQLDIDPQDGPPSYTQLLMTYFNLSSSQKQYLALQYVNSAESSSGVTVYKTARPTDQTEEDEQIDALLNDLQEDTSSESTTVSRDDIATLTQYQKLSLIRSVLRDEADSVLDEWNTYLSTLSDDVLTDIVYHVLVVAQVCDTSTKTGTISNEDAVNFALTAASTGTATGEIKVTAKQFAAIVKNVISHTLYEAGLVLPAGLVIDGPDDDTVLETMKFDYTATDTGTEGVGELFQKKVSDPLHPIYYGSEVEEAALEEDDIWFEYLSNIQERICYSDPNTMVIRVDERLIALRFDADMEIHAIAFDDIMLNFHGKLGIRYMSILADLLKSGKVTSNDLNIFYKRLITVNDHFDPELKRLYTGNSYVVSTNLIDTVDYSILYSTNIGRFTLDYSADDTTMRERQAAYRMSIDYRTRDFAFLNGRMLVFVNGKYIPPTKYTEQFDGHIELTDFHELISVVDILYSKKDLGLMQLKKKTYQYWQTSDPAESVQRPDVNYTKMVAIQEYDYTKRGYYDVLINDLILNGKLLRLLNYFEDHQDEGTEFAQELIAQYHAISDTDVCGMPADKSRIIISGDHAGSTAYYDLVR